MNEFKTEQGTRYVTESKVILLCRPQVELEEALEEMAEFDPEFEAALHDYEALRGNNKKVPAATLLQFAGQLCYLALGKLRTPFSERAAYLGKIMEQAHGSVLEHANYSFLLLGIDRACTHELVRHRAGMAYSQVSQRYVGPEHLRFVRPWEDGLSENLRVAFEETIDTNARGYRDRIDALKLTLPQGANEFNRDYRKRIQGSARSVLGNYVEAPIVVTGNIRAWRHVLEMRCSRHADVRIRLPMLQVLDKLQELNPECFGDFLRNTLSDGTQEAGPTYRKV